MKKSKNQPLEIVLFYLLGKPTRSLIKTLEAPAEKVRQRSSHFYFYSNRDKEIVIENFGNKVKQFQMKKVYRSEVSCKAYIAKLRLALQRDDFILRKSKGKVISKKDGKTLVITSLKEKATSNNTVTIEGF